jgi:hypothetical protein
MHTVDNPGAVLKFLPKSLGFQKKNYQRVSILALIAISLTHFWKFAWEVAESSPFPPQPPCASLHWLPMANLTTVYRIFQAKFLILPARTRRRISQVDRWLPSYRYRLHTRRCWSPITDLDRFLVLNLTSSYSIPFLSSCGFKMSFSIDLASFVPDVGLTRTRRGFCLSDRCPLPVPFWMPLPFWMPFPFCMLSLSRWPIKWDHRRLVSRLG